MKKLIIFTASLALMFGVSNAVYAKDSHKPHATKKHVQAKKQTQAKKKNDKGVCFSCVH